MVLYTRHISYYIEWVFAADISEQMEEVQKYPGFHHSLDPWTKYHDIAEPIKLHGSWDVVDKVCHDIVSVTVLEDSVFDEFAGNSMGGAYE